MKQLLCFLSLVTAFAVTGFAAERLPVLIVDGQNNHDWKTTTPLLRRTLDATGRFDVEVFSATDDEAWKAHPPDFRHYRAVLLNYMGRLWPVTAARQLEAFVAEGGGLIVYHAALASFEADAAFNRMFGVGWRPAGFGSHVDFDAKGGLAPATDGGGSGHGKIEPFILETRTPEHPIVAGLPAKWLHASDELYHTLRGPAENMTILASAFSPVTRRQEPLLWTVPYAKGRVFVTALGHGEPAIEDVGFQTTLARGVEWAATGAVTLSVPANFPKEQVADSAAKSPSGYPAAPSVALVSLPSTSPTMPRPGTLSRATIERFRDNAVQVAGRYAAVRLPIQHGVPLHNPCAVASTPEGLVFAANYTGEILLLRDTDGDGLEDTAELFTNVADIGKPPGDPYPEFGTTPQGPGLRYPTGMTYKDGWLYVATTSEIVRFRVAPDGKCQAMEHFATGWPYTYHYFDWTFGLCFGKDGWLYANLTTDYLNGKHAPDPNNLRGSMIRISPDGKNFERFACGLRYSYGIAINDAGDVFATDNEGGGNPTEELNYIVRDGNYGHHPKAATTDPTGPILEVKTASSADGCAFNPLSNTHFGHTSGDLFIACWGHDGQWRQGGIARVTFTKKPGGGYDAVEEAFSHGPAKIVALCFAPSGDMYVARFGHEGRNHSPNPTVEGDIYRYIYADWLPAESTQPSFSNPLLQTAGATVTKESITSGSRIFEERACSSCHSLDGSASKLGPDLRVSLSHNIDRAGLMESILEPSKNIKTDYETTHITKKNGDELTGRVTGSDEEKVTLMQPGNTTVAVSRADISKIEQLPISLMPPGLLTGLSDSDTNDLIAYLQSLGGQAEKVVRINAGGEALTVNGENFQGDEPYKPGGFGYINGSSASVPAGGDALAASCRYGDFTYRFDGARQNYDVTLTFAENWLSGPGQRIFSVLLNGKVVLADLDVFKEAGKGKLLTRMFRVHAGEMQGSINLTFAAKVQKPMVSAIEVKVADDNKPPG